jgi:segregation and condensation protein B
MQPTQIVEALLFASDAPLTAADIAAADDSLDEATVEAAIHELRQSYEREGRAFQIYELAGGFQILTRPEFAPYLERFDTVVHTARLSPAALEVLAIIAYRQPIGRAEIEEIRGVGSAGVLRTLQERELITPVGRGDGLGRPVLYGTTTRFLEHFGFRSLEDLPRPEELPVVLRERGPVTGNGQAGPNDQAAPGGEAALGGKTGPNGEAAPDADGGPASNAVPADAGHA